MVLTPIMSTEHERLTLKQPNEPADSLPRRSNTQATPSYQETMVPTTRCYGKKLYTSVYLWILFLQHIKLENHLEVSPVVRFF